ncbi:type II secretion system F family protein [Agrococcus sp. HG114]|uniref:type II secretion system F family protein n=1 Tax=Agrococcus sp. HG114 TaxID=2969757 RepID=UPI00215B5041|nr:type II secretion system F family protein [Agrococcus sp. HG114]MCR8670691.1 type II secretion system F family protein [Agrococcus sp. HG114]
MTVEMLLPALLVGVSLAAAAWAMAVSVSPARVRSLANLRRGDADASAAAAASVASRAELARRLTPRPIIDLLDRQHARAGRPADWTVDRLLVLKMVLVPAAVFVVLLMILGRAERPLVLLIVLVAAVSYFLPDLLLYNRGLTRDQQMELELADTLDQMTIAVEAGLAFDAAMARAASNGKGALAEELTRTLQDMRMGKPRREAFGDLASRTRVSDLRQFVRAVIQADANGISVGDVLRTQAAEMRLKRRQRAEMKAQQVPVKVLMPLILCIMPVLFIVIIGPAILSIIETFSSM